MIGPVPLPNFSNSAPQTVENLGKGIGPPKIVRVIVRERGTTASKTVLKRLALSVDFIGSFRLTLYGV
jgi:hypothetical protein